MSICQAFRLILRGYGRKVGENRKVGILFDFKKLVGLKEFAVIAQTED